jgi:DNA-binding NtrC family response regulator
MTVKGRIFLLDDDELIASMLARALKKEGYAVQKETRSEDILNKIASWCPDLVLLDIHLEAEKNGLDILDAIKRDGIPGQVVMLTADDSAESAIAAMKLGAADYLTKPFDMDEVKIVVKNIIEKERLREEVDYLRKARTADLEDRMIGESPAMVAIMNKAEKLAEAHVKIVLITPQSASRERRRGLRSFHRRQLHGFARAALRERALWSRERGLHRCEIRQEGDVRAGGRRHDPPG